MNAMLHGHYDAYKQARTTVSKTKQIVMLYEGILKYLKQAEEALQQKNIEGRFNAVKQATDIMIGLQQSLDHEKGGDVAQSLYDFYSDQMYALSEVNRTNNPAFLQQVAIDIRALLDQWKAIDSKEAEASAPANTTRQTNPNADSNASSAAFSA